MKLPDEDIATADIAKKYRPQLEAAEKLFDLFRGMIDGANVSKVERVHICLASVLTRLLRLHYASVKLASVGLAAEAKLTVRAMFQLIVNVLALEKSGNSEQYARRWVGWDLANYMKQIERILEKEPEKENLFNDHRELVQKVKDDVLAEARAEGTARWPGDAARMERYAAGRWEVFLNQGPSQKDLRGLSEHVDSITAEECALKQTYDTLYLNASCVMHGSDIATLIEMSEKELKLTLAPVEEGIELILVTSSQLLRIGGKAIARILKMGPADLDAEVDAVIESAMVHLLPGADETKGANGS